MTTIQNMILMVAMIHRDREYLWECQAKTQRELAG